MTDSLNIALAQLNPSVGDIAGNIRLVRDARAEAARENCDLIVFTELFLTGYPPEDLLLKPEFISEVEKAISELEQDTLDGGPAILLGAPYREKGQLYNAALLIKSGQISAHRYKYLLPNYGVFDEVRVFEPGPLPGPIDFKGCRLGVMICEDMWADEVSECLMESGADLLLAINGSPYELGKTDERLNNAVARVTETNLPLIYVNQIGGQDELVFDGASFVLGADRSLRVQAASFLDDIVYTRWQSTKDGRWKCDSQPPIKALDELSSIYSAMVLGLKDYVEKNNFPGVVIGLSGGIDSALSASVAVDALGADRVTCVMMPSLYTQQTSIDDAIMTAKAMGVNLELIKIGSAMVAFEDMLSDVFKGLESDVTEENIQARVRGVILMAISNKMKKMVLTTGNKSELSVGYATLYGDMCGGFSVLKDVYKTVVFELSRWRNQYWLESFKGPKSNVIPDSIINKPPSAELRYNQTDQDTLPPYELLDGILKCIIEDEMGISQIVNQGYDIKTVERIWHMIDVSEYKRRQSPPGVKLTGRAFGKDRRYPITNLFLTSQ